MSEEGKQRLEEAEDASRRTHLANERTYLAWWRTGLTCLAVALAAGRLVPSISHQEQWPYAILGAGFAVLGLAFIAFGLRRQRDVRGAVARREFSHPDDRLLAAMTAIGVVLGLLLLTLVLIQT